MTPEQEKHLEKVITTAIILIESKYRKGQKEHGGNLYDLSPTELINEAINEAIDQLVYLLTAKEKLKEFKDGIHFRDMRQPPLQNLES